MKSLLTTALEYHQMGLSVIATGAFKQSIGYWKDYQQRLATGKALHQMFNHPAAIGIAVVTGNVSGNLEVIDLDTKYDLQGGLLERLLAPMEAFDAALISSLVIAQSRSGGYHLYYRCQNIERNQHLARRPVTAAEIARNPNEKVKVLIETRGEGGYIIVPPSKGYQFLQHDFSRIPTISIQQRHLILQNARDLNEYVEQARVRHPPKIRAAGEVSPLDDYNQRGDIVGFLEKHGWTVVPSTSTRTYFKRPGDSDQRISGSYHHELGYFSVFSTSTEFQPRRGYRPSAVYAILECNGDFRDATRRLAEMGYGEQSKQSRPHCYRR